MEAKTTDGTTAFVLNKAEGGSAAMYVLVAATPDQLQEVARVPALDGETWNTPAFAGGILLVRNTREMAAFDLRPAAGSR